SFIHWPMRKIVAEMPFSENPGAIASRTENLRHGRDAGPDKRAARAHGSRPIAQGIHAGHQLPARGSAHRRNMEIGESHALIMQPVEVGSLDDRVAVTGKIPVTLVI